MALNLRGLSATVNDFGMPESKQRKVVVGNATKFLLALHIDRMGKERSHEREVHTESSREVSHALRFFSDKPAHDIGLIAGGAFAGTLLQREARRIGEIFHGGPSRHLGRQALQALGLLVLSPGQRPGYQSIKPFAL